jgi:hypothetical protein
VGTQQRPQSALSRHKVLKDLSAFVTIYKGLIRRLPCPSFTHLREMLVSFNTTAIRSAAEGEHMRMYIPTGVLSQCISG